MPSTRKRKARERRSRQIEMMSDVEYVDMMLGSSSRDGEENNDSEKEIIIDKGSSGPQQNSNLVGEDIRSLLKTSS